MRLVVHLSLQEISSSYSLAGVMSKSVGFIGHDSAAEAAVIQDPLASARLARLVALSAGSRDVRVAIIDGPVDIGALGQARLHHIRSTQGIDEETRHAARDHGTAVAGLLASPRWGICPGSTILVRPIFMTASGAKGNVGASLADLTFALSDVLRAGPHVINLSLVVDVSPRVATERLLRDVLDAAARQGVLVVAATANSYVPTHSPLLAHPWVLPIVASDAWGRLPPRSQLTPAVRRRALSAPGLGLSTVAPGGGSTVISGSSAATAVVTGTVALLRALFPQKSGDHIRWALTHSARSFGMGRRFPSQLDAWAAFEHLAQQRGCA
jgi:subtilisin family serine protease